MDKNIAALLRNDTTTVAVRFYKDRYESNTSEKGLGLGSIPDSALGDKLYTYVTDLTFKPGDHAIVLVMGIPKIVRIEAVHDTLDIEPNDDVYYKWIVCGISFDHYNANIEKNKEITGIVSAAYKQNIRQSFNNLLLASIDEESRIRLVGHIGAKQ